MNPLKPNRTPRQNEKPLIDSGFAVGGYSDILEIKKTAHPIRVNGQNLLKMGVFCVT